LHGTGGEAVELTNQVFTFMMTIVTGMVLGILFDSYRVLRGTCNPQLVLTWCMDLLYWLVATVIVFIALVSSNWGELRFYVFIGMLTGVACYYHWLSIYIIRMLSTFVQVTRESVRWMKKIVVHMFFTPGLYCIRMLLFPFIFIWKKMISWFSIRWPKRPDEEKK